MVKNKRIIRFFCRDLVLIEVRCYVVQDNEVGTNYDLVTGSQLFQGSLFEVVNRHDCNIKFEVFVPNAESMEKVFSFVLVPSDKAAISLDGDCVSVNYDI